MLTLRNVNVILAFGIYPGHVAFALKVLCITQLLNPVQSPHQPPHPYPRPRQAPPAKQTKSSSKTHAHAQTRQCVMKMVYVKLAKQVTSTTNQQQHQQEYAHLA